MKSIVAVLFLSAAAFAQARYFPLQVGNQWIYRLEAGHGTDVRIAEVLGRESAGDAEHFVYKGMMGEVARIRSTSEHKVTHLDANGKESVWFDFETAVGASFSPAFDPCTGEGRVVSRSERVNALGRQWESGIRIAYGPGMCADAGVLEDVFVPGVGLVERTYQSIAGPRRYRLTYARLGNATILADGEYSFRIHLNEKNYPPRPEIHLRLTLENRTPEPLVLRFNSGQSYDFAIRDHSGRTFYVWSADKLFTAEYREVPVTGEKSWAVSQRLDLPRGEYVIEAWLTTADKPFFKAQIPFTVGAGESEK